MLKLMLKLLSDLCQTYHFFHLIMSYICLNLLLSGFRHEVTGHSPSRRCKRPGCFEAQGKSRAPGAKSDFSFFCNKLSKIVIY